MPSNRSAYGAIAAVTLSSYLAWALLQWKRGLVAEQGDLRELVHDRVSISLTETDDFDNQVAGHIKEKIRTLFGCILEPLIKPKHFFRELRVYKKMEALGNHWTQSAKAFVPPYRGLYSAKKGISRSDKKVKSGEKKKNKKCDKESYKWDSSIVDDSQLYLGLKDLTAMHKNPCVIDIKMGTQTFEPGADLDKRRREVLKCPYQSEVGFRIVGFKVYDVTCNSYGTVSKHFGRKLVPEVVYEGLALFFFDGVRIRRDVILVVIQKLEKMLLWMKSQNNLHFYCSSILIVYDGHINNRYTRENYDPNRSVSRHFMKRLPARFPPTHLGPEKIEGEEIEVQDIMSSIKKSEAEEHEKRRTSEASLGSTVRDGTVYCIFRGL